MTACIGPAAAPTTKPAPRARQVGLGRRRSLNLAAPCRQARERPAPSTTAPPREASPRSYGWRPRCRRTRPRPEKPDGHLALAPLALACLAHDSGIPVDVESGYPPHHLLPRGWLGEFPT
ncbi:Imm49 family immunity protein [Streptomyces sp. NPDC032161]|uniref:Imm49 family immunity protein n=1 Tax=unclassified Streptomyces TaxID=2593676 RepID=UPI0033E172A3